MFTTKEELIKAFEENQACGIKPVHHSFVQVDENEQPCGMCAISALIVHRKLKTAQEMKQVCNFHDVLEISGDTMWGLIDGFDQNSKVIPSEMKREDYEDLYTLGTEVRNELIEKGWLNG